MNFRSNLLIASLIALPLAACGDDGGGSTSDASTGNATPGTNPTTTTDPGTTAATEPETTDGTTAADTTSPTTTDPATTDGTTDPTTTDGTTTDGTTGPGTTTGDDTTTGVQGLSWAADVYPVLAPMASCDCHNGGAGGLKLGDVDTSYMNLVDVKSSQSALDRVEPGDPDASYLLDKINGTHIEAGGSGMQMPIGDDELPQETRDLIEQWILDGALP